MVRSSGATLRGTSLICRCMRRKMWVNAGRGTCQVLLDDIKVVNHREHNLFVSRPLVQVLAVAVHEVWPAESHLADKLDRECGFAQAVVEGSPDAHGCWCWLSDHVCGVRAATCQPCTSGPCGASSYKPTHNQPPDQSSAVLALGPNAAGPGDTFGLRRGAGRYKGRQRSR